MRKNRGIYRGIAFFLMWGLLGCSGCDKVVASAVVEEKGPSAAETKAGTRAEENAGIQQKRVPEQVEAPETYQADFSDELAVWESQPEDSETAVGEKMKLHVAADASVEVPDVEAICLKQVSHSPGNLEQMKKWADILRDGGTYSVQDQTGEDAETEGVYGDGAVTVQGLPYLYSYTVFPESGRARQVQDVTYPSFLWSLNWEELSAQDKDKFGKETEKGIEEKKELAQSLLNKLGLSDFRVFWGDSENMPGPLGEMISSYGTYTRFRAERLVDGVPVTYVMSPMYLYTAGDSAEAMEADSSCWEQETVHLAYVSDRLETMSYFAPLQVEDYSDEALFLLPFEEICQIFRNTIGIQLTGEKRLGMLDNNGVFFMYPQANAREVEMQITKVKLGYMRQKAEDEQEGDLLVPVWDFFGTWKAEYSGENGKTIRKEAMESANVSLLTIDARDGSIIQRMCGY